MPYFEWLKFFFPCCYYQIKIRNDALPKNKVVLARINDGFEEIKLD